MIRSTFAFSLVFALCFASVTAIAQQRNSDRRSADPIPFPRLEIPPPPNRPKEDPTMLSIAEVDVDVAVVGNIASTRVEIVFSNTAPRVLEGQLVFPLAEGQTVTGFEMEVEGNLRAGVVVEKARGREIFEEIVRQGIDPGLLEQVGSNSYKARVYPIPANGTKRLALTYEQVLLPNDSGHPTYQLPLALKEVKEFGLRVEVVQQELEPKVKKGGDSLKTMKFDRVRESWIAELSRTDFDYNGILSFKLPEPEGLDSSTAISVTQNVDIDGLRYGVASFSNFQTDEEAMPAPVIDKVTVLWDVSASGANRDNKAELACLMSYLETSTPSEVTLQTFHIDLDQPMAFDTSGGNFKALRYVINALIYDGATQIGVLDFSKFVGDVDAILVFTDGISTLGKSRAKRASGSPTPVHVVTSSATAEHTVLRGIAAEGGGEYRSLAGRNPKKIGGELAAGQSNQIFVLGVSDANNGIVEIVPERISIMDGRIDLGVAFKGKSADVEVILGDGDGNEIGRCKAAFHADDGTSGKAANGLVRRLFAQRKIAGLQSEWPSTRKEIVSAGQRFGVVTRGTSLIVLDRMEDYVRYEIAPPEPGLRKQYLSELKKRDAEAEKTRGDHLKAVAKMFTQFEAWYDGKYEWLDAANLRRAKAIQQAKLKAAQKAEADVLVEQAESLSKALASNKEGSAKHANAVAQSADLSERIAQFISDHVPNGIASVGDSLGADDPFGASTGSPAFRSMSPQPAPAAPMTVAPASDGYEEYSYGDSGGKAPVGGFAGALSEATESEGMSPRKSSRSKIVAGGIQLAKWDPKTPYLKALKKAKADDRWTVYGEQRDDHGESPAFFLDVADLFRSQGQEDISARVLSNLAEMESENHALLRILGYRLLQLGKPKLAVRVFEEVLELRGEEPQSYRDLAAALSSAGDNQRAAEMLWKVVSREWDDRFPQVELIALHELNALLDQADGEATLKRMPNNLRRSMPVDIRAVMTWDADLTDIDLWVTGPDGEKCYYGHNLTKTGGKMSNDFTAGYGPEVFLLKRALPGSYRVQANYYGSRQQTLVGPATLQLELITNFGRPNEKRETTTLRLEGEKDEIEVGTFLFGVTKKKR